MISVVVPVFNEGETLRELHSRIFDVMNEISESYEIIFVNDGSTDNTREIGLSLSPLKLVTLQRNSGQTAAIDTGIQVASGDIIVLLDADLQNDPAEIPVLLDKIKNGFDVVIGRRRNRRDARRRMVFSRFANWISRYLLNVKGINDFGCGLKAYRSKFIKDFRLWGESQVFLVAVAKERGARITEVPVTFNERQTGTSKISIYKMMKGGFDLLGIAFFVRYFSKPLRFFGGWGVVLACISFAMFVSSVVLKVLELRDFSETPLPIIGTLFAVLGVMLFMMGLLAEMLLRIYYLNTENTPYMVKETIKNE